jgi:methyl-accepting chemotaxis protein
MGYTTNAPAGNGRAELSARLSFLEHDEKGIAEIRNLKAILAQHLPVGLDKFYDKIKATPEISGFFRNDEQIAKARSAQLRHWSGISSGEINETYVANTRRVGQTHARIGLEPRWYIGGYALLLEHLIGAIIDEYSPKGLVRFGQRTAQTDLKSKIVALMKAVMLDMDLSISTYIEAAEEARLKAESEQRRLQQEAETRQRETEAERKRIEEAAAAERAKVLDTITASLAELAKKNLSYRIASELPPQFECVRTDYNSATGQLDQVLQVVMHRVRNITGAMEQIPSASDNLSRRTQKTAAALEESAAALKKRLAR